MQRYSEKLPKSKVGLELCDAYVSSEPFPFGSTTTQWHPNAPAEIGKEEDRNKILASGRKKKKFWPQYLETTRRCGVCAGP